MKLAVNRWWLVLACGMLACLSGCQDTESGGKANAKTNAKEDAAPADATVAGTAGAMTDAPDSLPQPYPKFKGKIGETYHDSLFPQSEKSISRNFSSDLG